MPHPTRVMEPLSELNIEMFPSSSSTTQSLVEAFDPKEVLGPLRVDLELADECVSDPGCVAAACKGQPAIVWTRPKVVEDVGGSGEG